MNRKHVGYEVKSLARKIDRILESGESDLTRMQLWLLNFLFRRADRGQDVFQRDVELRFQIRRSTATELLNGMEKLGLVERVPVASDGRLKKIALTAKALQHQKRLDERIAALERKLTEGFTPEEIDCFYNLIERFDQNASSLLC